MIGDKPFTVRGIMRSGGLTSAFGGNLAIMDIYAAQQVFGRGRRFDRIDLKLREGVAVEAGQAAIRKELGVGFDVEPPASRGQQLESTLAVYAISMNVSSVFALFIGMFIIYNSFSIAVTQRRSEIGILRALGAPRRQIRNLFLIESAASGLLGSIAGIALGIVMARGMVGSISNMLEGIYGVAERAEEVSADPRLLGAAIAIGIVTSMIAAWLPARNASRVDPVQALQKGKYQVLTAGENRARRLTAAVMMAAAIVMLWLGTSIWFYAGYTLIILAALMLVPTVALWFSRALRPVLKWLRPVEGALAADSLIQSPRRTSGAVAALMLSLGQVIGLGGIGRESYNSIVEWLNTALNPDLFVSGSQNLSDRTFRFPKTLADSIAAIPGVEDVQHVRSLRVNIGGGPVMLIAIDAASFERRGHRPTVAEDPRGMYPMASAGQGVIVSDNFARLHHKQVGDRVEVPTPGGLLTIPIAGIITDWSDQQGSIFLDRAVYEQYWKDDTVNVFRVYVTSRNGSADGEAAHPRAPVAVASSSARADQRRGAKLGAEADRSVAAADLQPGLHRRPRRDPRHRQYADGVDHRSQARARRAARGRRVPAADPSDCMDGSRRDRTGWPGARVVVRRGEFVFPAADHRSRPVGDASAVPVSLQHRGDAASDDSRRGVLLGALAGGVCRAHVARRGIGI